MGERDGCPYRKAIRTMNSNNDMVMRRGGQMIVLMNGEMLIMEKDVFTTDGTQVNKDGLFVKPDGEIGVLQEDEAMLIDRDLTRKMVK